MPVVRRDASIIHFARWNFSMVLLLQSPRRMDFCLLAVTLCSITVERNHGDSTA